MFFFFSSRRRHTRSKRDWSSDVCSSDLPEINSRNGMRRGMAERTAINSPIQGTAADIIKLAMIRIAEALRRQKLRTRMVLQVHDELIFEVPEEELYIGEAIRNLMQDGCQLNVPLTVDVKQGKTWEALG